MKKAFRTDKSEIIAPEGAVDTEGNEVEGEKIDPDMIANKNDEEVKEGIKDEQKKKKKKQKWSKIQDFDECDMKKCIEKFKERRDSRLDSKREEEKERNQAVKDFKARRNQRRMDSKKNQSVENYRDRVAYRLTSR